MKLHLVIFIIISLFVNEDEGKRFGLGGGGRISKPKISQPHTHSQPSSTHFINHEATVHRPPSQHSYPAGPGLSGNRPNNPSSGGHAYPASPGLSGSRPNNPSPGGHAYPSSGGYSGSSVGGHSYPAGSGLSGGTGYQPYHYKPLNSQSPAGYNGNYQYHSGAPSYGAPGYTPLYSSGVPQYGPGGGYNPTYVSYHTQSGSNVNDLIVGLAAFNLIRSVSGSGHQRVDHYYHNKPSENPSASNITNCTLQLTKEGEAGIVSIPCEYVSSFANSSNNSSLPGSNETLTDCTISITRNGHVEKTNVSCAKLARLAAEEASPPAGTLNCTQEVDAYKNPFGFTPCRMADSLKEPDVPFEVIPLKVTMNDATISTIGNNSTIISTSTNNSTMISTTANNSTTVAPMNSTTIPTASSTPTPEMTTVAA